MASEHPTLSKSFELRGLWWLPSAQEIQVAGTLKFDPSGEFVLSLDGVLGPTRSSPTPEFIRPEVIHGITNDGKYCSLLKSYENSVTSGSGYPTSKLTISIALIGLLTKAFDEVRCQSAAIEYTNLEAWIARTGFTDKNTNLNKKKGARISVEYSHPPLTKYSIPCIQSTIKLESRFTKKSTACTRVIEHSEAIRLRPSSNRSLEWFLEQSFHLRNLLSLFATQRVFYRSLKVQLGRRKIPEFGGRMMRLEADVIIRQPHFSEVGKIHPLEVPFPHPVIRSSLPNILETWFNERERLQPVHELFFGSLYNERLGIEFQFLSQTQALESLHRRFHRGRYISKAGYESCYNMMVGAIPTGIPSDLRSALKSRIHYGNEFSLRKRLTLMGRQLNKRSRDLISDDFKGFVASVVDTRNHLTHYDPNPDPNAKILSTKEMIIPTISLRLLLTIYLFKRIGMPESSVAKVIAEHPRFRKPQLMS